MVARVFAMLAVILGVLALGMFLGGHPGALPGPLRDLFVGDEQAQRYRDALDTVEGVYYRKVSERELTSHAISGMIEKLDDPYSRYFTPSEYRTFEAQQAQQFSGIGVGVTPAKRGLRVEQVYPKSPAGAAGIRKGDMIVEAAGTRLAGRAQSRSVDLIKGREGTRVRLGVVTPGRKERRVTVTRRSITVPQVDSRVRTYDGKRYLQLAVAGFTQEDVDEQVKRQLARGRRERVAGVVLDLRHNPGGLVTQAQRVSSIFLKPGQRIVSMRGRNVETKVLSASGEPAAPDVPLVVLVDRMSASASEIVAGALQDHRRAKVVGTRTYGKGVFQQVIQLPDGGALDITAGQYFTPKGTNLGGRGTKQGTGLAPDIRARDDLKTRNVDEALQAALKALAGGGRG